MSLFGLAITVPLLLLLGALLLQSASAQRAQLQGRVLQVLDGLVSGIDRDLDRDITILHTLATSQALAAANWPTFYDQAKAGLQGRAYLVLVDSNERQLVNTYVPYGQQPPTTGDPETVRRIMRTKEPVVSNLFVSLVVKKPVFNVSIPIVQEGHVRYVMSLGLLPDDLLALLTSQTLEPQWVTLMWDAKGMILARSQNNARYVGTLLPEHMREHNQPGAARTTNLDGTDVLHGTVRSRVSGWGVGVNVPYSVIAGPMRNSLLLWSAAAVLAITIALALGLLFARQITTSLSVAAEAAAAFGRGEPFPLTGSRLKEASAFLVALENAHHAREQLTEEVKQSRDWLQTTLASIGDGVIATDELGRVTQINGVAESLTGWKAGDAAGRPLEDILVILNEQSRQPAPNPVHRVLRDGVIVGLANHTLLVAKDGREIPIDDSAAPIRAADGRLIGVVMVFRDVSEPRRVERENAAALAREREANATLERVANELRHLQSLTDTGLSSLNIETLIRALLARVRTALHSDIATILLADSDGAHLIPSASDGLEAELGGEIRVPIGRGVAGRIALSESAVIFDDLGQTEVVSPILQSQVTSLVGAPLKGTSGRLIGVVYAGASTPRNFTEADAHLLSLAADRIAVAVERARLHETERTARREAETASEQLRVALEAGRMGTWEYTMRTGDVKWSPGLEAIHGYEPGMFPRTFDAFRHEIHPDDCDRVLRAIQQAVEERRAHHVEYRIIRTDGTVRWVEGRGQLFLDEKAQPDRMVGVCLDVTERKQAEERFQLIVEASPTAMIAVDARGEIVLVNALTERLLGYDRHELIGQSIEQLVPKRFRDNHPGHRADFFHDLQRRPMGAGRELYALRKDGAEVPVEIGLSPFKTSDGTFVLAAVADITERKRAEDERAALLRREQAAHAEADAANRAKDEFLAMISHELRTPLNAVLGWADMLRTGMLPDGRREHAMQAIFTSAKRQEQLIGELLDVSRIISGKLRLERTALDVQDVARTALDVVQAAAQAKHIHVAVDIEPSLGPLYADAARLQQILLNLLSNAIKFTPDGGAVRLRGRRSDTHVEFAVMDTGQGISATFLPFVFEPFQQGDRSSTTRRHGGLGLGLAIVKHLVEAHEGTVTAESAGDGQGSAFVVRLPIVAVYADHAEVPAGQTAEQVAIALSPTSLYGVSVLVVDDDEASRDVLATTLETYGARVVTAATADDALHIAMSQPIDVLVSDVAMPDEDGYGLIRAIRRHESHGERPLSAVALTSFARDEDRQRALDAGFQRHLAKPIDSQTLVEAVASLANRMQTS